VTDSNDDPRTKKTGDLTSLSDLAPSDAHDFATTIEPDAPMALEGLDDLMNPMAPTSTGVGGDGGSSSFTFSADPDAPPESMTGLSENALLDPIATLAPIDGDTLAAAAGTDRAANLSHDGEAEVQLDTPIFDDPPPPPRIESTAVGQAISGALSATTTPVPTGTSMDAVRNYSDHVAPSANAAVAETPYSLVIEGPLRVHEREMLLSILSRENLGIREVELEPQFSAGHILIPRISEYAGVMIVQALRNTLAKIRLGPSERIFVSRQADDGDERLIMPPNADSEVFINEDALDRAETVLLTSAETVPGKKLLQAIDTLHNSINLKAINLSHPQSPLFQDAIERLKKQLKFQAHHRGANALVGFKYTLHPLEGQAHYKLVVEARAVRVES
jgi:uncharacterized protein YbjQ (UPF0145 family)